MIFKDEYEKPIEVAEGVYWVGKNVNVPFRANPYLIVDDGEAVLIDPGSPLDFFAIRAKVASIISPTKIKHIVLHHQDPDLCGSTRQFEVIIGPELKVYNPLRSSFFVRFYGIETPVTKISTDGDGLTFQSGRKLKFIMTPYCHAPGAMITYDEKTKTIFTSDIFGAFNPNWEVYADQIGGGEDKHIEDMRMFMEPYMGCKEAMDQTINKMKKLDIGMICPQHGSIIRKNTKELMERVGNFDYGIYLKKDMQDIYLQEDWASEYNIKSWTGKK